MGLSLWRGVGSTGNGNFLPSVESKPAGDRDGTVWGWRAEGVGEEGEGGRAPAAGAVADAEVAGAALRKRAAFRRSEMGLQDLRASGRAGAADVGGVSSAAAVGSDFGFSLRDALEPAGQPLERRAVYGCAEAGEEEAGSAVCASAGGRRLHRERAAGGFAAAGCAVHV